jgi:DNA-binding protein HU-beta
MKKSDLVNEVAKTTLTKAEAARGIEIFLDGIKKALKKKYEVYLSGFGTFSTVKRKARKGRNPKTGQAVKIAAKFTPRFKPAKAFKEVVK